MTETISNTQKTTRYIRQEDALKICEMKIQDILDITDVSGKRYEYIVGTRKINADEIAEQIKKIPFTDVRPVVRGKWINPRPDSEMCSVCGIRFSISSLFAVGSNEEPNFCPNCGADMRGEHQ